MEPIVMARAEFVSTVSFRAVRNMRLFEIYMLAAQALVLGKSDPVAFG